MNDLWFISNSVVRRFPYYDPLFLGFMRWGAATAFGGLLVRFWGQGKLRCPAGAVCSRMVLLRPIAGMGE